MWDIGISSACYYPQPTEEAFLKICKSDVKLIEIFFNTFSELSDSFLNKLIHIKNNYDVKVSSVHPFLSFAETYFLFSDYERRFYDTLEIYKKFFEVTRKLDSDIFIIHGLKEKGVIEDNQYFDRFAKLIEIGKQYGVRVCQENVVLYRSQSSEYLKRMSDYIGKDFNIVLDIKQAKRANEDPFKIIEAVGDRICHVHISDHNALHTCIPPFEGDFNFSAFFKKMKDINYRGNFIIELYSNSYHNESQIYNSLKKLKNCSLIIE